MPRLETRVPWAPPVRQRGSTRVTKSESFSGQVVRRVMTLQILVTVAVVLFCYQVSSTAAATTGATHQKIQPKRKMEARPRTTTNSNSSFKHQDYHLAKAKLTCSNCHIIRPPKPPDVVATAPTTEVKTYPYHDKCLGCHRVAKPQLFRGSTPIICAVCHKRSSPALTKRDMNPFPKQSVQMILGDLSLKFNHESTNHRHECASCHLDVAQLDSAMADAPLSTCATSQCHQKPNVQPGF